MIAPVWGAEYHGQVRFGGLPLPGATVTATQGDKKASAVSDPQGAFSFADLPDGAWQLQVEMLGFTPEKMDVATGNGLPGPNFDLKMLPLDQIQAVAAPPPTPAAAAPAQTTSAAPAAATPEAAPSLNAALAAAAAKTPAKPVKGKAGATAAAPASSFQRTDLKGSAGAAAAPAEPAPEVTSELSQRAADAGLINGSAVNGASTPFAQNQAFGNARRGARSLYNGNISLLGFDTSALDARSYSLTGQDTLKPTTSRTNLSVTYGGPIRIPHLIDRNGPNFRVSYQRIRNSVSNVSTAIMPDAAERAGNFSQEINAATNTPVQIFDSKGNPFANNIIPTSLISKQAMSLLQYYPLPNFAGNNRQNFQVPLVSNTHTDNFQATVQKGFKRKNNLSGTFAMSDTRGDSNSQFDFLDLNRSLGMQAQAVYRRNFTNRLFGTLTYQFSRQSSQAFPYFANNVNVSGNAGISGNDQAPIAWGPPSLAFGSSQIAGLSDQNPSTSHNQSSAISWDTTWSHGRHGMSFGGDFRWIDTNLFSQSNPRGGFTFNGASTSQYDANGVLVPGTGSDFASFLLGVPDASSIAFGNADKYFRSKQPDLYFSDDWRVAPGFTMKLGMRWEYNSPITEKYGRLVNLDVAPGFTTAAPVVASGSLKGSLTGQTYPDSLIKPDKKEFEPSVAFSWRPFPASSMVVRGGYSLRYNTQVYQPFANQMDQQAPLSTSLRATNSAATPLTLANGFYEPPTALPNTFGVDPNFRVGSAQVWTASVQRDLPAALVMIATYTGTKGTHLLQAFLPNTYAPGAPVTCAACLAGYTYYTSGGNSEYEAGRIELRRRMHNGFQAQVAYTYSQLLTDAASLGGGLGNPAQNWLNLSNERGPAPTDQRHAAQVSLQYTSGMGVGGGTLLTGWRGKLIKDWTFLDNINLGSGLPLTPRSSILVDGLNGVVRASYTGASLYAAPTGFDLNPLAVQAPTSGWGNAGVGSIVGPGQFTMNASMSRAFRLNDRYTLNLNIAANNPLNHRTDSALGTTVGPQFGFPIAVNAMRSVQTTVRLTF